MESLDALVGTRRAASDFEGTQRGPTSNAPSHPFRPAAFAHGQIECGAARPYQPLVGTKIAQLGSLEGIGEEPFLIRDRLRGNGRQLRIGDKVGQCEEWKFIELGKRMQSSVIFPVLCFGFKLELFRESSPTHLVAAILDSCHEFR